MTEPSKPREFWIRRDDLASNPMECAVFVSTQNINPEIKIDDYYLHVIEKSHADALEKRVRELEAKLQSKHEEYVHYFTVYKKSRDANAELSRKLEIANNKVRAAYGFVLRHDNVGITKADLRDYLAELNGDK